MSEKFKGDGEGFRCHTDDESIIGRGEGVCSQKKHPCPDCVYCQWCGEDRCRLCRECRPGRRKLSLAEQVELYEKLNKGARKDG